MKKSNIIIIAVIAVIAIWMYSNYNGLVTAEENVEESWSEVSTQYQRRMDLIPKLAKIVAGYAKHEKEALEAVVNARSKATQITIDPSNCTPEQLASFQKAQGEISSALSRLMAIQENYPELKANKGFEDMQVQLEGTENRISVARNNFNKTAQEFNTKIRKFPTNILASLFGFEKKNYFAAEAGAEKAPDFEF